MRLILYFRGLILFNCSTLLVFNIGVGRRNLGFIIFFRKLSVVRGDSKYL